jgi:ketosteroid isomerase-like protein
MKRVLAATMAAALFALPALAADDAKKIVVEGTRIVELADGGSILLGEDGHTYHTDAAGKRVRMKDGIVMTAKDGSKILHKNDAIWKQITEKGTMAPNR